MFSDCVTLFCHVGPKSYPFYSFTLHYSVDKGLFFFFFFPKGLFFVAFYLFFPPEAMCFNCGASQVAQLVKNSSAMQETPVQFLGWEVPLEKG